MMQVDFHEESQLDLCRLNGDYETMMNTQVPPGKAGRPAQPPGAGGQVGRAPRGRENQKQRTRMAIVEATRRLARTGVEISMPAVAREALVSEATAYRYFPDLASLLREADEGGWPDPAEALAPVADSTDPAERVAYAAEFLLRGILSYQGAVRAMISASITKPPTAASRPGHRFGLIDYALAPVAGMLGRTSPEALAQLRRDLAVVMSAEALFTLMDLCGLEPEAAITSAVTTARKITQATLTPP